MEISALEIRLLLDRISVQISGYFLSGVYSVNDGVLFRLNHETKPEKLVVLSSFAPWITTKNISLPRATPFLVRLRRNIERCALVSASQVGNERIAQFTLENRKGDNMTLIAEFFAHGNLILTDPTKGDVILDVATPLSVRHRTLRVGEKYVLPPSRGLPLQEVNKSKLLSFLEEIRDSEGGSNITSIKWFGRNVGTSRKFVEEIFYRSGIDPNSTITMLDNASLEKLAQACSDLCSELERSSAGYILIPTEESELDADVCPIIPHSWSAYSDQHLATIRNYLTLSEALDEVEIQSLVLEKRRVASASTRAKEEELASAIAKQRLSLDRNVVISNELRLMARKLITSVDAAIPRDVADQLMTFQLLKVTPESPNQPRFVTEPKSFLRTYTPTSLASRLFDEAKQLEQTNLRIESVLTDLIRQKDLLSAQTKSQEERVVRMTVTDRREHQWFERYRWFVSSDDRLIVGGRDSTSNSIVINKYTNLNDIVFHADLHGSPFFVVGNSGVRKPPTEDLALEIAQATVGFSRAWKDELGSADAYWVYADQVKKSAPSGEYLPRGSFFIEGKKNFVRHVKVELSIGVTSHIPGELEPNDVREQITIVCGPEKSIAKQCLAYVLMAPGKERSSEFSKRVLNHLIARVRDENKKEAIKRIPKDDIIRVLPSGEYKLISENRNRSM